jgi:hypothetical protein
MGIHGSAPSFPVSLTRSRGRLDRPVGVIRACEPGDEECDGLVPHKLVDDPVPAIDHSGGRAVEAREQLAEFPGRRVLGETGRAAHVGEERGDLDLGSSGHLVRTANTPGAEPPFSDDGPPPKTRMRVLPGLPKGA